MILIEIFVSLDRQVFILLFASPHLLHVVAFSELVPFNSGLSMLLGGLSRVTSHTVAEVETAPAIVLARSYLSFVMKRRKSKQTLCNGAEAHA
jgi:hypothetical protein